MNRCCLFLLGCMSCLHMIALDYEDIDVMTYSDDNGLKQSCVVSVMTTNDKIQIHNFLGVEEYGGRPFVFNISGNGITLQLGQVLYSDDDFKYVVGAYVDDELLVDNSISMQLEPDGFGLSDGIIGIHCIGQRTGTPLGWNHAAYSPFWRVSNATLSYALGNRNVENRVYASLSLNEMREYAQDNNIYADTLTVSNIMPDNIGCQMNFLLYGCNGVTDCPLAAPAMSNEGDYFLYSQGIQGAEAWLSDDNRQLLFPASGADWLVETRDGIRHPSFTSQASQARIEFDKPLEINDGIHEISTDADVPIYYNLQGVRIPSPCQGLSICLINGKVKKILLCN